MTINDVERRAPIFGSVARGWMSFGTGPRLVPSSHRYQGTRVFCSQQTVLKSIPQIDAQPGVLAAAESGAGHCPWSEHPV